MAENSGGPKAVKYGVVKDYVLNLEVVLPSGEVIMTGANVLKNATGYNLTQLMVGSEGTLGVVTAIVLRLIPCPHLINSCSFRFRMPRRPVQQFLLFSGRASFPVPWNSWNVPLWNWYAGTIRS